ncbi:hypothetical protein [Alkalicoccus chagannorensis]|uniref:hypothetical protein n=1 Tax=Alkalicoccus chagannorensis TaxID=427072 RepID=UPI0003FDE126|nr:hypothetical protein [Alkalicoccus chagannorensis]
MMNKRRDKILVILSAVLVAVGLLFLYFQMIQPELDEREATEEELESETQYAAELEAQLEEEMEEAAERSDLTTEHQRRLPVVRLTDQFLLDLSMAEELSEVRIMDIDMTYDQPVYTYETTEVSDSSDPPAARTDIDDVREEEPEEDEELVGTDDDVDAEDTEIESDLEDREEETADADEAERGAVQGDEIDGVRRQTALIELKVNTYDHLSGFLEEVDALVRDVNIDSILFLGQDSDRIFDGESDIFFEVEVSSYYYPELEELEPEAPIVDYPEDEDRDSPFGE